MSRYPTPWQRKTMWAALSAFFIVFLIAIVAYLLDPLVTRMCRGGLGRTRAVLLVFATAFFALGGLIAWLAPTISMQSANFARELPGYTQKARDRVVDLIVRYDRAFG